MKINNASGQSNNIAAGYKCLVLMSMFYMTIMLCNAILTNRYIGNDSFFVLGGTFTSPFVFILDDIVAEIYGYKVARSLVICAFLFQALFIIICQIVLLMPCPNFFREQNAYYLILGPQLFRIHMSGFVAFVSANLLNSYILSRWKILLKGKYFWLRSVGSSVFSEAFYTIVAISLMELYSIPLKNILIVTMLSFLIKVSYSILFSFPADYLVNYLKKTTGIDIYDVDNDFTPFKIINIKTRLS